MKKGEDDLSIPDFLDARKRKPVASKNKEVTVVVQERRRPSNIPASYTIEEWDALMEEKKNREQQDVAPVKKKPLPKIDTKGKRWDARKSQWVEDEFAHLAVKTTTKPKRAVKSNELTEDVKFGIPEGTNRDKLAKAMLSRLGTMTPLSELSVLVYGDERKAACNRVMDGFISDLKKRKLPFEVIKDKDEKDELTFGLFKL